VGASESRHCSACSSAISGEDKFCPKCGAGVAPPPNDAFPLPGQANQPPVAPIPTPVPAQTTPPTIAPQKKGHKVRNGITVVVLLLTAFGVYNRVTNSHDAPATPLAGRSDSYTCTDDDVTTAGNNWVEASNRAQLTVSFYIKDTIDDETARTRLEKRLGQMRDGAAAAQACLTNPSQEQLRLINAMTTSHVAQSALYTMIINVTNGGSATKKRLNKQVDDVNASIDEFGPLWRKWSAAHNFELEEPPTTDDGQ
jgi:hypothetical protein